MKEKLRTYSVTVTLSVGLAFNGDEKIPRGNELKQILAENVVDQTIRLGATELVGYIDKVKLIERN